jgi:hypothetical protein
MLHCSESFTIIKRLAQQLSRGNFAERVIHSPGPAFEDKEIIHNRAEYVGEAKIYSLLRCNADQSLAFVESQLSRDHVEPRIVDKLAIGINIASQTFVTTKEFPIDEVDTDFLLGFPH